MSGIFGTMNIANSGLQAMQSAVNTTSNNISNAQTEGYSRKRVNLVTNTPQHLAGIGEISTGVRIDGVTRIRDVFTDRQVRTENARLNSFEAQNDVYDQLEIIFNEPSDTGISDAMQEMWNAWQELSKTPESVTARTIVLEQSTTMADRFNHTASQLDSLKAETLFQVNQSTFEINAKLEQLSAVDTQIQSAVNREMVPNDLLDQRDLLLDQLSSYLTFSTEDFADGGIQITIDSQPMLEQSPAPRFSVVQSVEDVTDSETGVITMKRIGIAQSGDSNNIQFIEVPQAEAGDLSAWRPGTVVASKAALPEALTDFTVVKAGEGKVSGLQSMLSELDQYTEKIDALASGMAALINTVHSNGGTGTDFFTSRKGDEIITAASIQVNSTLKGAPELIAAGKLQAGTGPDGDGSRALAIASLRDVSLKASDFNPDTMRFETATGDTSDARYRATVAGLGVDAAYSRTMAENETSLLNQLHQRRESVMGVSIDEEISALVKFQNGYQANARVMTTLTNMLDTLINMVR
ncbi:flagellar hook-associated protein FlgK [Acidaminobacter hydrogenoformans]|uniref:Flagellar hook-associated protein 1 n=1 Tax=Acidaminobacter hydrogenoformans DSM 2784 TaxID=1120920 RepID=A0A1G5RVE1_9FIRM|nr:flagellar hook-associated protein FlgK [Acidaminobacter hydrogenoformans]SCZ77828.1 flagellar hook-associated protein 1 FlgK [Acidaminobacter hydrogenoformans DSM 2784]